MIFRQIRSNDGTGTLSYLIADNKTLNGIIIDPNLEDIEYIKEIVKAEGLKVKYIVDTHTHADHKTAAKELKALFGSKLIMHINTKNKWKVVDEGDKFGIGDILRANEKSEVDLYVEDGDEINMDSISAKVIFTPGHTDNHISILIDDMIFTGDLLLIGQAGRSDLPGGNPEDQYDSLFNKNAGRILHPLQVQTLRRNVGSRFPAIPALQNRHKFLLSDFPCTDVEQRSHNSPYHSPKKAVR